MIEVGRIKQRVCEWIEESGWQIRIPVTSEQHSGHE
jgi:hypothetical protein